MNCSKGNKYFSFKDNARTKCWRHNEFLNKYGAIFRLASSLNLNQITLLLIYLPNKRFPYMKLLDLDVKKLILYQLCTCISVK